MYDDEYEQQRRRLEERNRLVEAMVQETLTCKQTYKAKVNSEHRIKQFLSRYQQVSKEFILLHNEQKYYPRKDSTPSANCLTEFYTRLKNVRDAHRDPANEIAIPWSVEFQNTLRVLADPNRHEGDIVDFTDEEGYGRFLDLHECYHKYLNLKKTQRIDYISYVNTFDQVEKIPLERKSGEYKNYVECMVNYLISVIRRVKPLLDLDSDLSNAKLNFEKQWAAGTFPGWPKVSTSSLMHAGAHLELTPFNSAEELQALGLDRLKSALVYLGLKCGGTLEERAERLFSTKGKNIKDLDVSLMAKTKNKVNQFDKKEKDRNHEIAYLEAQLKYLADHVNDLRRATIENVERKQARIFDEDEQEEDDIVEEQPDDDAGDEVPYNPKNLPLGWDGKPIPYWLYKLHGLNLSFPCEICGNQIYKGPKAFQKHFSEWRHAHGMRCLGIPNTAHFANITKINDAIELWKELRDKKERERFKPDTDEEFEDSHGNVVNRKTYDDLRRQGLL